MDKSRGLFLVLDGLLKHNKEGDRVRLVQGLAGALKDFRALGFRIIGIVLDGGGGKVEGFDFDEVVVAGDSGVALWDFPPVAWSVARRYSLNVRRSLLCSPDLAHEGWARDAGLKRFETPTILFGI